MEGNIYKYNIGTLKEEEAIHSVPARDYWFGNHQMGVLDEVLVQSDSPGALIYKYL